MDDKLFEEKYQLYHKMVFRICYSMLLDIHNSEDATQETFIKFFRKNRSFPTLDDEKYYIIRIAINTSKDILRKRKPVLLNNEVISNISISNDNSDKTNNILWFVEKLDNKYKEIIFLRYVNNFTYKDISKVLNISEPLARKRHERAIKQLKLLIGEYE